MSYPFRFSLASFLKTKTCINNVPTLSISAQR
nr:MAG TPA: hypothetical protein [Caudoviricetes sp.]